MQPASLSALLAHPRTGQHMTTKGRGQRVSPWELWWGREALLKPDSPSPFRWGQRVDIQDRRGTQCGRGTRVSPATLIEQLLNSITNTTHSCSCHNKSDLATGGVKFPTSSAAQLPLPSFVFLSVPPLSLCLCVGLSPSPAMSVSDTSRDRGQSSAGQALPSGSPTAYRSLRNPGTILNTAQVTFPTPPLFMA